MFKIGDKVKLVELGKDSEVGEVVYTVGDSVEVSFNGQNTWHYEGDLVLEKSLKDRFPIGCKVKLINHPNELVIGKIGIVVGYDVDDDINFLEITWEDKSSSLEDGSWFPERFEVVKEASSTHSSCPRCNRELFEKKSEYTGEKIMKCKCGWC